MGGRSPRAPISDGGSGKPTTNAIGRSGKVTIDNKYFKKTPWAGCVQANGAESAFGYSDAAVNLWKAQAVPPTMNADPNVGCPSPMLGLSGNRQQVIDTLERMKPAWGGTHADVGLRWGLRTLTPGGGWPEFFGTATAPKNWNSPTKKIAVLITDGKNEKAQPYPGFWGCDVFDPVCSGTYSSSQLDTMMAGWCKAFRETYGITLYTVAMNVTDAVACGPISMAMP